MSLSDDLKHDFEKVFFADFNHRATINGIEIIGYLDINSHQFSDLDTNQRAFLTPVDSLPKLKRGQRIDIEGKSYQFITQRRQGDLTQIIVEFE